MLRAASFVICLCIVQQLFSFCGSPAGLKGRRGSSYHRAVGLEENTEEKWANRVRNLKWCQLKLPVCLQEFPLSWWLSLSVGGELFQGVGHRHWAFSGEDSCGCSPSSVSSAPGQEPLVSCRDSCRVVGWMPGSLLSSVTLSTLQFLLQIVVWGAVVEMITCSVSLLSSPMR